MKAKLSDTASFQGFYTPPQATSGTSQYGQWAANTFNEAGSNGPDLDEALPAASRVQLTQSNGIIQTGSPQQYGVRLSIRSHTPTDAADGERAERPGECSRTKRLHVYVRFTKQRGLHRGH